MADADWQADRMMLRQLMRVHPEWTPRGLAPIVGRSLSWTKDWYRRIQANPDNPTVCIGRSRARKTPPTGYSETVIARILDIRDHPPDQLGRIPGPKTILYYLHRDPALQGERLPSSTRTIWRMLRQHQRLVDRERPPHQPVERPAPMQHWQLDYKDASTVPGDPEGKRKHAVEILNTIDVGTSFLIDATTCADFQAHTTIEAVAAIVQTHGLPQIVQYDRDSRFVGGPAEHDFPAPFTQFWLCLGVQVIINPPHRPDKNAFVERYHRSLKYECLWVKRPRTLDAVRTASAAFQRWYNDERPHQGASCGNQPPTVAHPHRPALPSPPLVVDPDAWVDHLHGATYACTIDKNGTLCLQGWTYYVGMAYARQKVTVQIDAPSREIVVAQGATMLKRLRIKGLTHKILSFTDFVAHLMREAKQPPRRKRLVVAAGLERRTPLASKTPLQRKTPLRRRSRRQQRAQAHQRQQV